MNISWLSLVVSNIFVVLSSCFLSKRRKIAELQHELLKIHSSGIIEEVSRCAQKWLFQGLLLCLPAQRPHVLGSRFLAVLCGPGSAHWTWQYLRPLLVPAGEGKRGSHWILWVLMWAHPTSAQLEASAAHFFCSEHLYPFTVVLFCI